MARRDVALKRIGPLSAFRVGLAFSLVALVAWLLAVCLLWFAVDSYGIVDQVNSLVRDVGAELTITFGLTLSIAALIGAVMAVLTTIMCPIVAVIYNAIVDIFGGLNLKLVDH